MKTLRMLHTPAIDYLRRMAIEAVLEIPKLEGSALKTSSVGSQYNLSITRVDGKLYAAVTDSERKNWISGEVSRVANPKKYEQHLPVTDHGVFLGTRKCDGYLLDVYEITLH